MRRIILFAVLMVIIGMYTQSCKDCEPTPSSNNSLTIGFYRYDSLISFGSRVAQTSTFEEVSVIGNDTILYDNETTAATFEVPLSNISTSSFFTFEQSTSVMDTLEVVYLTRAIINGPDCGLYEEYRDISVGVHTFDSVHVGTNIITLDDAIHVEVFY